MLPIFHSRPPASDPGFQVADEPSNISMGELTVLLRTLANALNSGKPRARRSPRRAASSSDGKIEALQHGPSGAGCSDVRPSHAAASPAAAAAAGAPRILRAGARQIDIPSSHGGAEVRVEYEVEGGTPQH
jgi:hypothetical protein